jgi:hypothetical protein
MLHGRPMRRKQMGRGNIEVEPLARLAQGVCGVNMIALLGR